MRCPHSVQTTTDAFARVVVRERPRFSPLATDTVWVGAVCCEPTPRRRYAGRVMCEWPLYPLPLDCRVADEACH